MLLLTTQQVAAHMLNKVTNTDTDRFMFRFEQRLQNTFSINVNPGLTSLSSLSCQHAVSGNDPVRNNIRHQDFSTFCVSQPLTTMCVTKPHFSCPNINQTRGRQNINALCVYFPTTGVPASTVIQKNSKMMFLSTCLLNFLVLVIICHVFIEFQRFSTLQIYL